MKTPWYRTRLPYNHDELYRKTNHPDACITNSKLMIKVILLNGDFQNVANDNLASKPIRSRLLNYLLVAAFLQNGFKPLLCWICVRKHMTYLHFTWFRNTYMGHVASPCSWVSFIKLDWISCSIDKWLHPLYSVGWNYLSIPKLQRLNYWEWISNLCMMYTKPAHKQIIWNEWIKITVPNVVGF